jgi:hypothetical protein
MLFVKGMAGRQRKMVLSDGCSLTKRKPPAKSCYFRHLVDGVSWESAESAQRAVEGLKTRLDLSR